LFAQPEGNLSSGKETREEAIFCRLLKNAQMQGAPAFAEAATRRQAKS
jgi:hypothetical protein